MTRNFNNVSLYLGTDPEFFFKSAGRRVIGAENILSKTGLVGDKQYEGRAYAPKFIIDGVQAELNPRPQFCRAYLANEISKCFYTLTKELEKQGKGVTVSFEQSVQISKTELAKLDKENQKLGCGPSLSTGKGASASLKAVNAEEHRQRSAGGHIHLGLAATTIDYTKKEDAERVVNLLDIICGNTCVLVDRDRGNIARRKLYGMAGEYRLPKHGLEYRTLSNFWLKAYPLMSLVFGLARFAAIISHKSNKEFADEFLKAVDMEQVHKAINTNNYSLALKNFNAVKHLFKQVHCSSRYPLNIETVDYFLYFAEKVRREGLEYWFKEDPVKHWCELPEAHTGGAYDFLTRTVAITKRKEETKARKKKDTVSKMVLAA